MKKIVMFFLAAIFVSSGLVAQTATKWYSWNDGYEKAKKDNKVVIVDVYTEWCGWCKVMDKKTYGITAIANKISKNFVAIKVNPEKDLNLKYDGKTYSGKDLIDLLSNNGISGYPTTIFFFPKTKKTYLEVGYKDVAAFEPLLDKYSKMKK